MQPTLIIGLGGTGTHVAAGTLARLLENPSTAEQVNSAVRILCFDTDPYVAESLQMPERYVSICVVDLDFVEHACQHDENLKRWFDCEAWRRYTLSSSLFNPVLLHTAMYRQFGRLCLYRDLARADYSRVTASIHQTLMLIQQDTPHPPLVIICASMIGGTGSAIALDVAYLVRDALATMGGNAHVLAAFALGNVFASALAQASEDQHIRWILNQVAAIEEIQHYAGSRYEFGPQGHVITFDNLEPLNSYWLFGGDSIGRSEGKWPTDYYSLIASELCDAILSGDWVMRPKGFEYVNIQAPLTTNVISDWSYWKDVYSRHIKDPNRLSPHISREFAQ